MYSTDLTFFACLSLGIQSAVNFETKVLPILAIVSGFGGSLVVFLIFYCNYISLGNNNIFNPSSFLYLLCVCIYGCLWRD